MTDSEKIEALADALRTTRTALLVIMSPAIDRQLTPERRTQGHNAIELAGNVLLGIGVAKVGG